MPRGSWAIRGVNAGGSHLCQVPVNYPINCCDRSSSLSRSTSWSANRAKQVLGFCSLAVPPAFAERLVHVTTIK